MRRWFQFSLRSLLLLVLLVATYCAGWKSSQLKHERELQEAVRKAVEQATKSHTVDDYGLSMTTDLMMLGNTDTGLPPPAAPTWPPLTRETPRPANP